MYTKHLTCTQDEPNPNISRSCTVLHQQYLTACLLMWVPHFCPEWLGITKLAMQNLHACANNPIGGHLQFRGQVILFSYISYKSCNNLSTKGIF